MGNTITAYKKVDLWGGGGTIYIYIGYIVGTEDPRQKGPY